MSSQPCTRLPDSRIIVDEATLHIVSLVHRSLIRSLKSCHTLTIYNSKGRSTDIPRQISILVLHGKRVPAGVVAHEDVQVQSSMSDAVYAFGNDAPCPWGLVENNGNGIQGSKTNFQEDKKKVQIQPVHCTGHMTDSVENDPEYAPFRTEN